MAVMFFCLACNAQEAKTNSMTQYILYVGTYTVRGSRGIYGYSFNANSGSLHALGLMAETVNPSFLAVDIANSSLYAVSEIDDYKGQNTGAILAYKVERKSGKLTQLNQVSSQGAGPCFLFLDRKQKYLFTTNYVGGTIAAFPILSDGRLGAASAVVHHEGAGANPTRQSKPHPHCVELRPDGAHLAVADLGLDKLLMYRFDLQRGSISSLHRKIVKVHDGAGPRHFVFSRDGRHLYLLNEIESTVSVFLARRNNAFESQQVQTVSTLPSDWTGHSDAAEIRLSHDERFLYVSNRGLNDIAVFAVDHKLGTITATGHYCSGGKIPWSFDFSPGAKFLVVANQGSDHISVLRNDAEKGILSPPEIHEKVASPASFAFFRLTE